jgi:hypothetical protein
LENALNYETIDTVYDVESGNLEYAGADGI